MIWYIALCVGLVLILTGTTMARREHRWIKNAEFALGKVIQLVYRYKSVKPQVRFRARNGSIHEFESSNSSPLIRYSLGKDITVAYDAKSYEARILSFGEQFGFPTIIVVVGCAATMMALAFMAGKQLVPKMYASSLLQTPSHQD